MTSLLTCDFCGQPIEGTHVAAYHPDCDELNVGTATMPTDVAAVKVAEAQHEIAQLREVAIRAADLALFDSDCGDNSCHFAKEHKGMRTNGGCQCIDTFPGMKFKTPQRNSVGLGSFVFRLFRLREALAALEEK